MDAVRTGAQRHVKALVDEDPRGGPLSRPHGAFNDPHEGETLVPWLPDLNQVHSGACRRASCSPAPVTAAVIMQMTGRIRALFRTPQEWNPR
jgi:hypothetical protein